MKRIIYAASLVLATGSSSLSHAASYTQQTESATTYQEDFGGFVNNIVLPDYDQSAGLLESVTITARGEIQGTLTINSDPPVFPTLTLVPVKTIVTTFAPGLTQTSSTISSYRSTSPSTIYIDSVYGETFTDYGVGDFLMPGYNIISLSVGAVPTMTLGGDEYGYGTLGYQIVETFNVPEPSGAPLMSLGIMAMLGIAWERARERASSNSVMQQSSARDRFPDGW